MAPNNKGMTMIDMSNDRYQRKGMINPYNELCTRAKSLNGEKINGIPCCYGLDDPMTDDMDSECKKCISYLVWKDN